jgi:hypothetical protein
MMLSLIGKSNNHWWINKRFDYYYYYWISALMVTIQKRRAISILALSANAYGPLSLFISKCQIKWFLLALILIVILITWQIYSNRSLMSIAIGASISNLVRCFNRVISLLQTDWGQLINCQSELTESIVPAVSHRWPPPDHSLRLRQKTLSIRNGSFLID